MSCAAQAESLLCPEVPEPLCGLLALEGVGDDQRGCD